MPSRILEALAFSSQHERVAGSGTRQAPCNEVDWERLGKVKTVITFGWLYRLYSVQVKLVGFGQPQSAFIHVHSIWMIYESTVLPRPGEQLPF